MAARGQHLGEEEGPVPDGRRIVALRANSRFRWRLEACGWAKVAVSPLRGQSDDVTGCDPSGGVPRMFVRACDGSAAVPARTSCVQMYCGRGTPGLAALEAARGRVWRNAYLHNADGTVLLLRTTRVLRYYEVGARTRSEARSFPAPAIERQRVNGDAESGFLLSPIFVSLSRALLLLGIRNAIVYAEKSAVFIFIDDGPPGARVNRVASNAPLSCRKNVNRFYNRG